MQEDFIRKLMSLFRICEDLEDMDSLHIFFKIVKGISEYYWFLVQDVSNITNCPMVYAFLQFSSIALRFLKKYLAMNWSWISLDALNVSFFILLIYVLKWLLLLKHCIICMQSIFQVCTLVWVEMFPLVKILHLCVYSNILLICTFPHLVNISTSSYISPQWHFIEVCMMLLCFLLS